MRHEEEEKRAKELLREEEGTGRKGRLGIDLDSGVAVIGSDEHRGSADASHETDSLNQDEAESDDRDDVPANAPDANTEQPGDAERNSVAHERHVPAGNTEQQAPLKDPAAPPARPGEPQQAARTSSAVPTGKARRKMVGRPARKP